MEGGSTIENFDGPDGFFRQLSSEGIKTLTTKYTKVHEGKH
jgi:hypothetical protein